MVDAEFGLACHRHRMMRDRIEQPDIGILLRRAVGDDNRLDAVFLKIEREMQATHACADDPDGLGHMQSSLLHMLTM